VDLQIYTVEEGLINMSIQTNHLRNRLLITFFSVVGISLSMLAFVSLRAMNRIERERRQSSILSDVQRLSEQITQEYLSLLHISQQMIPQGSVGTYVNDYLSADAQYDRINASRMAMESIGLTSFTNPYTELVMYFSREDGKYKFLFQTMNPKDDFDENHLPHLSSTSAVSFQTVHTAVSRISMHPVISLTRDVEFFDDVPRTIYVEARLNFEEILGQLSETQNIPYSLIQIDRDNIVRYSTIDTYPLNSVFSFKTEDMETPDTGRQDDYLWARSKYSLGFRNVILIPKSSLNQERSIWLRDTFVIAAGSLLLILALSLRLYKQVTILLANVCKQEQEKQRLELDKLYAQINPHFILNALNSAHWMTLAHDRKDIAHYLSRLKYLLGYTLGKTEQETTIHSEIQLLSAYIDLQKERNNFSAWIDVQQGEYLDRTCARLILQPIAENAICHNVDDGGNLWVNVSELKDGVVQIIIKDDGVGFEGEVKPGIGLQYVYLSLDSFYNGKAKLEIESSAEKGTAVTLKLPKL
jgi:two-component system sensor histidine kinase YesM